MDNFKEQKGKRYMTKFGISAKLIRMAIGCKFVAEYYRYGVVTTHYQQMGLVRPGKAQRSCRKLLKDAVAFPRSVYSNLTYKEKFLQRLGGSSIWLFQSINKYSLRQDMDQSRFRQYHSSKDSTPDVTDNFGNGHLASISKGKRQYISCKPLDRLWLSIPNHYYLLSVAVGKSWLLQPSFPGNRSTCSLKKSRRHKTRTGNLI